MFTPYVLQYSGTHLGHPAAVGRTALDGGLRHPGPPPGRLALPGTVRPGGGPGQRHQRQLHPLSSASLPVLWLPYAVVVAKEATWRRAWGVAWKVGLLTALVSLWWAVGLQVEAAYGVNVLKYTETVPADQRHLAGLGDPPRARATGTSTGPTGSGPGPRRSVAYTQNLWLIGASFAVPVLSFVAAVFARWRHRAYFVLIAVVGMVLAVGPNPYADPSASRLGDQVPSWWTPPPGWPCARPTGPRPWSSSAWPCCSGPGSAALVARVRRTGLIVGCSPWSRWSSPPPRPCGPGASSPTASPNRPHAPALRPPGGDDPRHAPTPGPGSTPSPATTSPPTGGATPSTPSTPACMTRPFVTHEQQIMGSLPTADVLQAVDAPLQDGTMDWNALAPMASLMSAGDVLVQYDQAYERYDTPNPQVRWPSNSSPPPRGSPTRSPTARPGPTWPHPPLRRGGAGPGRPTTAGPARSSPTPWPTPRPIVRAESTAHPLVVDGDASGIVNAAAVGLLSTNPTILYAGTLDTDKSLRTATLGPPADLVVTDTNRKRGFRWNSLDENTGYTETAAQGPRHRRPQRRPPQPLPQGPGRRPDHHPVRRTSPRSPPPPTGPRSPTSPRTGPLRPSTATPRPPGSTTPSPRRRASGGRWCWSKRRRPGPLTLVQPQTGDPDSLDHQGDPDLRRPFADRAQAGAGLTNAIRPTVHLSRPDVQEHAHPGGRLGRQPSLHRSQRSVGLAEVGIPGVQADETVALPSGPAPSGRANLHQGSADLAHDPAAQLGGPAPH